MAALSASALPATGGSPAGVALNGWKLLAPIPDRVGFNGMIAGVLGSRLVAAGGSHFPEKPNWLKGEKAFGDRIFTLAAPDATWTTHAMRLPAPVGNAACAATDNAIYFAGGLDTTGCLRGAWEMRAKGDGFSFTALPDLPQPIGYATAAVVGGRLYLVGGLDTPASKAPTSDVWSLELGAPRTRATWRREPALPGPGVFVAAAATDGKSLFVFGGIGFDASGKPIPAKSAYRFDPARSEWQRLADLPEPRVGISSPCPLVPGNKFFLIGGYAEVFPGATREHPGFSAQTLFHDSATGRYENGPMLPRAPVADRDSPTDAGPAPMIGAPCVVWRDLVVVIGGETRASVRTPAVLAWPLR